MEQKRKKAKYRKDKRNLILFNSLISIVLAACILLAGGLGAAAYLFGDMKQGLISDDHDQLGISSEVVEKLPKEIVNIALFGLDSRDKNATDRDKALKGRSDTTIVVSINTVDNTIKLTSILRDSWVPISNGKGGSYYNKINAAYSTGGPQRAIHTLNNNFGLNIKDYVSISLYQLWNVIDIMGGIDIHITEWERQKLNYFGDQEGFNVEDVTESGLVHLSGGQAMCYARIRNDSEEVRVLRQQKVISALFEKAKTLPKTQYPEMLRKVLSNVETSMTYDEIFKYAPMLAIADLHIQSTSVPGEEVVARGGIFEDTRGGWVWKYDIEEAKKYIYKWIFGIED